MTKTLTLLPCLLLLLCQCTTEKKELDPNIIPVESTVGSGQVLNLSDYASSIEYIPLETNDSVLIGKIEQIGFEKDLIFLNPHCSLSFSKS